MKMDKYRKVSAVLLVFVCGFLLFELFVLKERSIKMISKAVVIILANIFFIFRLRMRDGNMPLLVYEALVQLNPDNAVARVNLAYLYQETESNEKAVDAYKKALEYAPENTTAYNNLGYLYIKMNCPAEALENAQKALELDETLYFSEETAAMASALLGDRELSEEYYQRCVQL